MRVCSTATAVLLVLAMHLTGAAQQSPRVEGRTGRIAGRISLPDGTPAAGVTVFAAKRAENGSMHVVAQTTSAWDGRYEIAGVPPGEYLVGARPDPQAPIVREARHPPQASFYPGVSDAARAEPIRVFDALSAEGTDIWLTPAPQRFSVSGRVFWPGDRHVERVTIEYGDPEGRRSGIWYVDDPGGIFTIDGVPAGSLVMLAFADSDAGRLIGLASTTLTVGSVEEVRIVLDTPGTIEGRVVFEGRPPATRVRLTAVQTRLKLSALYPVEEVSIDTDGRFRIANLAGQYAFELRGLPEGWRVLRVRRGGLAVPNNRLTVTACELISDVEIVVGASS